MAPSEGGKLTEIVLPPLLTDIIALHGPAAEEAEDKPVLNCPSETLKITGDPGQLVQLFVNLYKNAIESMPDGGNISVDVAHRSSLSGEDRVVVSVLDEGVGIDPSYRSRIFEPFFTTKPISTASGLSICQEIADFHRAGLTLAPRQGRNGTIAQIEFPCLAGESTMRPIAEVPYAPDGL